MSALEWIQLLLLGGLAGSIGQIARVVVGIKKLGQDAATIGASTSDLIDVSRLVLSIVIGLTAGALAAMMAPVSISNIEVDQLLAFAAAGYAGADFIEGAMAGLKPSRVEVPTAGGRDASPHSGPVATASPLTSVDYVG